MYDLIIIGAGPAGITAGIYAVRKRMKVLVITGDVGGQTNWTRNIENYTGYQFIPGAELVKRFREHLKQFDIEVREGERVTSLEKKNGVASAATGKGVYEAKTAVIASGVSRRRLEVDGENRLRGKGVAYCATCDALMFSGMNVAVVGGGNSALDAVLQLAKIARKIYLIDKAPAFRADPVMVEKAKESGKVTMHGSTGIKEILGEKFVQGIRIEHAGTEETIDVEGVFVEIGWVPSSGFARTVETNEQGEIFVNCKCETNVPGIFAAGDVTNVPAKQIIVACGEGAKAAISAFNYVSRESRVYA